MSAQATPSKPTITPRLTVIALVALVIAGLTTLDKFLANAQDVEVRRLAQRSYSDGLRLRRTGKINEAIDAFRKAHALERRNSEYQLELIDTLITGGKSDQAELLIHDILEREPNDGRANLLAAHLMITKDKTADAESYYHRAIYGEWPNDAAAHRIAVRMELVDFLAARGERQELLAELLPLQAEAGEVPATQKHLAQLFLIAGSASRAADEYRAVLKQNTKDADAHLGLGEAELQSGEYRRAHEAFLSAASYQPNEPSIQRQLKLSSTLVALDPTPRKLPSMEKYHRSFRILELARLDLQSCITKHPGTNADETRQLLTSANDTLTNKPRGPITNELAETVLSVAEKVWQARVKGCGASMSPDEEPLRLIMEKLAQ